MRNLKTIGTITFIAAMMIVGVTNISAANTVGLYERLFASNELVNSFLADARVGGVSVPPAVAGGDDLARVFTIGGTDVHDDLAPQSVETWTGGDNNNSNWTTNSNWAGIGGAAAGDDLVFPAGAARTSNTNDFANGTGFNSLTFTGGYIINGNRIVLGSGGITMNTASNVSFFPNLTHNVNQTWTNSGSGDLTLNGTVNLQTSDLTLAGNGDYIFAVGEVVATSLAAELIKQGAGTATFNGDSPNAPALSTTGGTAHVTSGTVWDAVCEADAGGTMRVDGTCGTGSVSGGRLSGTGTVASLLVDDEGGTIAPGGIGTTTGVFTSTGSISSGNNNPTLEIDLNGTTAGTFDRITATGGNISLATTNLALSLGFTPTAGQTFSIITTSGAGNTISGQFDQGTSIVAEGHLFAITYNPTSVVLTAQGPITSLTWDGGGTFNQWSDPNNWNPNAAPVDGIDLIFPTGAPADSKSNENNISGLELDSITIADGYVISSAGSGTGITLAGGIQRTADAGISPEFNIPVTLTAPQTFSAPAGQTILVNNVNLNSNLLTITKSGSGGTFSMVGVISGAGGLSLNGPGTVGLSGNNTYTGVTNVTAGQVNALSTNALGAAGSGNNTVVANGATLTIGNNAANVPESITINGTGINASVGALAANSCSGGCSVSGPITLGSNSAVGSFSPSDNLTLSGGISGGANGPTKVGPGTLVLTANNNTYTGTTTVNAGTLLVNGSQAASSVNLTGGTLGGVGIIGPLTSTGGTISPGNSPGFLNVSGGPPMAALGTATSLHIEIGGTSLGARI